MAGDAVASEGHLGLMLALAERLGGDGIAIYEHRYHLLAFGSWEVVVGTRHRRRRFVWDGRTAVLTLHESTFQDSTSAADWASVPDLQCDGYTQEEVFRMVSDLSRELSGTWPP